MLRLHEAGKLSQKKPERKVDVLYMESYRYIWAYREALCRSVHDMSKQKYGSKQYSPAAWKPLADWVHNAAPDKKQYRLNCLTQFNKDDDEFIVIVAKCLWSLATAPNLPWGRQAVQPSVYLTIESYEKVLTVQYILGCFFFLAFVHSDHIWTYLCNTHM